MPESVVRLVANILAAHQWGELRCKELRLDCKAVEFSQETHRRARANPSVPNPMTTLPMAALDLDFDKIRWLDTARRIEVMLFLPIESAVATLVEQTRKRVVWLIQ